MNFVCPLPPTKVFIKAEYLYDHKAHHGELIEGVWCSLKAIRGEAFRFETYLPQFAALYDKLPISAFVWHDALEDDQLPLDVLQIWDAMSYYVTVIHKPLLAGLRAEFFGKDKRKHRGDYLWTLDCCNPDPRIPDFTWSESADEHKSFNLIRLDNGQFALQPNNRCQFFDASLNPSTILQPDFRVSTRKYSVEREAKWRLGDTTTVDYDGRGEIDDGFGTQWFKCGPDCGMEIVRPGKVQCDKPGCNN